ncbi:MAG: PilZ domain-containing protein [Candidatus Omnitrophica bacterium]|nr:PilZ domain-containing protein [Candidatus Omnitrophota bacterium]MDD5430449.1 PilZ domain-containing protein [Candidatus Omnitrophota bacterium]
MKWDGVNKRRFLRTKYPFTVHIQAPEKEAISAYTEDLSEGGLKVTLKARLDVSSLVGLEIFLEQEPVKCRSKVIWVKERSSEYLEGVILYDTGLEFFQLSSADKTAIREKVKEIEASRAENENV